MEKLPIQQYWKKKLTREERQDVIHAIDDLLNAGYHLKEITRYYPMTIIKEYFPPAYFKSFGIHQKQLKKLGYFKN